MNRSIKVLYAEDELSLARIVTESLESRGFDVVHVKDGRDGLASLANVQPDICVLDIMMPVMDGYNLAKQVRLQNPSTPIIFLTAKTQTKDVLKGFDSGGDDYMRKPFSVEELIVRIENLVTRKRNSNNTPASSSEEIFQLGGYIFDPVKQELLTHKHKIRLSFRESNLLYILCQHSNRTCERKKILDIIWGDDSYYNSRNLDVYINKLRKLFRDNKTIEIRTLKGVGYLFITSEN